MSVPIHRPATQSLLMRAARVRQVSESSWLEQARQPQALQRPTACATVAGPGMALALRGAPCGNRH